MVHQGGTVTLVEVQHGLAVAAGAEHVVGRKVVAQRGEVVDLTVRDDGLGAVGGPDRLVSPYRIHDGKTTVAHDSNARHRGEAFGIGPTMGEEIEHRADVTTR